jgi:hypothetical protein
VLDSFAFSSFIKIIGRLQDRFFPKERDFYKSLADQAAKTLEGIEALGRFVEDPSSENTKRVRDAEQQADELRRGLIEELHKAFVTPMDREDIFALSRAVDDIVETIYLLQSSKSDQKLSHGQVGWMPRLVGGVKGHNINETSSQ